MRDVRRCGNCINYKPTNGPTEGVCRRHPPTEIHRGITAEARGYPHVVDTDWCGEWANNIRADRIRHP